MNWMNWTSEDVAKKMQENKDLARVNVQTVVKENLTTHKGNKYGAIRSYSELCGRMFDSKAEKEHGEELALLEKAGRICNLRYQVTFKLCEKPKITVTIDFAYEEFDTLGFSSTPMFVYDDVKGVLTRDSRTKYAWLAEKYGIQVRIIK